MSEPVVDDVLSGAQTIPELLLLRRSSERDGVRFLDDVRRGFVERAAEAKAVTRAELFEEASRAAHALAHHGVKPGDMVILLAPRPRDFFRCFFACQLVGAIPVPLVPPWSLSRMQSHVTRIEKVASICRPRLTIADKDAVAALRAFQSSEPSLASFGKLVTVEEVESERPLASIHRPTPSDTALVQFTSGSTSDPRGVELSHRALLSNCYAIGRGLDFHEPGHLGCSWLPLFHDMGLIGHVLVPLVWQIPTILMPPESFALRPSSWLEVIAAFGVTISTAPNFAYQLAATRLPREKTSHLDLSSWRVALCGGEPVLAESLEAFAERFAENGFERRALCPVYGLAEATLAVTLTSPKREAVVDRVDRKKFASEGRAERSDSDSLEIVSCGTPPEDHMIQIRDDAGAPCPERVEGEIWVSGPSLMTGYLRDAEGTSECLQGGFLRTGDRGYEHGGELFVTGRSKELIVKGGRNLYPQEIEAAASEVDGIRPGRVAAFAVPSSDEGTELLVVAAELREGTKPAEDLERRVLQSVVSRIGVRPDEILLLPPQTLTKTSSGKMQRLETQKRYLEDALERPQTRFRDAARLLLERARVRLR